MIRIIYLLFNLPIALFVTFFLHDAAKEFAIFNYE